MNPRASGAHSCRKPHQAESGQALYASSHTETHYINGLRPTPANQCQLQRIAAHELSLTLPVLFHKGPDQRK